MSTLSSSPSLDASDVSKDDFSVDEPNLDRMDPLKSQRDNLLPRLSVAMVAALLASSADADRLVCSDPLLEVEADTAEEAGQACGVALDAKVHAEQCGLEQRRKVTIEVRDHVEGQADHCAGLYYKGEDRIAVVSPSMVSKVMPPDSAFSSLEDDDYFGSLLVHELAHAFMEQTSPNPSSCNADQEYVAYALQIESLSETSRQKVLSYSAVERPVGLDRLNDFTLSLRPDLFAMRAWTHFRGAGNGCAFIQKLLNGGGTLKQHEF